ncbi:patched domain-containing protein 3-like [Amphiura filiformis]|uniref:patched domain-containing protein 3-like n=1 Tax=Amphiura filiformis TaxID=82378 RepID=UPI003B2251BD
MKFDCVEKHLRVLFSAHGKLVGKHPAPFIIIPLLLTVMLAAGMFTHFTKENDPEALYGPQGSESLRNRDVLEDMYSDVVDENMLPRHQLRIGRSGWLIVTPKTDDNILTIPNMKEVLRLHRRVMNVTIQQDDAYYTFEDLCLKWNGECHENEILALLDYTGFLENVSLTYPFAMNSNGERFLTGGLLGGVTLQGKNMIEKAEALLLAYPLRYDTNEEVENGLKWERTFLYQMEHFISDKLNVYRFAIVSVTEDLGESTGVPLDLVVSGVFIVAAFCILSTTMLDWVRSKPLLAILGLFTAGLSLGSTFGLLAFIGIPYASTAASMPFLILASQQASMGETNMGDKKMDSIGVDDMFIMISAWRQTSVYKSVPDRMSQAMEDSALSITITSVTDALAFGIGCITQFYSIRLFCIYACIAVLFCYLYMITFFAASVVITGYREKQNRHALTFLKVLPKQDAPSNAYFLLCAGGSSTNKDNHQDNASESSEPALMIFFKKYYGPFVTHPLSAAITVLLFLAYIGLAIWGCVYLEEGGELKQNIATDDSYLSMYYKEEKKYFRSYGPDMSVIATSELEYWKSDVQRDLENVMADLEASEYFHDSNVSISWLRNYLHFLSVVNIERPSKEVFLNTLRKKFLVLPVYKQFVPDIIFDSDNQSIVSSRFYVIGKDLDTTVKERDMFWYIRGVVAESNLDLITYTRAAPRTYEQFIAIRSNTILTMSIGVASMFLIAFLLIPHPICAITVTFSVVSTLIGVIGYMSHLSIPLDSISMVTLIISMGFSVDYSAHISYAYTTSPYQNRRKRSIHALYSLGAPTLQGAISTALAVFTFAFSKSYIFRTFFWTMFLVIVIGTFHGLLFLPVFLMLLVPNSNRKEENKARPTSMGTVNSGFTTEPPAFSNSQFNLGSRIFLPQRSSNTPAIFAQIPRADNTTSYPGCIYQVVYNPNHRRSSYRDQSTRRPHLSSSI